MNSMYVALSVLLYVALSVLGEGPGLDPATETLVEDLAPKPAAETLGGSCWAARLCCQGRNLSCHVMSNEGVRQEKVLDDKKEVPLKSTMRRSMCFCDSACVQLNDCCHDYKLACQEKDCIVSEDWTDWSECSARCGPGIKNRTRKVLQKPLNGGKSCPTIIQRVACEGTSCKVSRANEGQDELRESGRIIPREFGEWRDDIKYNPFKDIRKNIFERYHRKDMIPDRASYCMEFEVTEAWPACSANKTGDLVKGSRVCVVCQPEAMKKNLGTRCKGHGVLDKESRWNELLIKGCRGKWIMRERKENCSCESTELNSFILL